MIDAALALRDFPGMVPSEIATITGKVNPLAIKLESRPAPTNGLLGRLSFQHAIAVALIDGVAYPAQFTDERVNDACIAAVRQRISVDGDETMAPDQCELTIVLNDGRSYTERVAHATGTPHKPVTDEELERKFRVLAGHALPKARLNRVLETLWQVDSLDSVAEMGTMCKIPRRRT